MEKQLGYHQRGVLLDMLDNYGVWPPHWRRIHPDWAKSLLRKGYIQPIEVRMQVKMWDMVIDSNDVPTYRITDLGRKRMAV
jgi:hypothetical protein